MPLHTQAHEAPRIDGRLDDAVWQVAPRFDAFKRFRPEPSGSVGAYRTEAQLLLSGDALVVALRAWDPQPQNLRAPLARRDQVWPDQDSLTVWIDPNGRQQVAQFVRVNAAGSIRDGLYTAATDDEDDAPDFLDVEVGVQRLADGWSAEIRWPLASLRYPLDGQLPWRLMLSRRIPSEPAQTLTSVLLERGTPHLLTEMQTLDHDAPLRERLAHTQHRVLRSELTLRHGRPQAASPRANLGLELQWRPRADWVLDATLRPDFSQVELDDPQLAGNTRFALFVPEKRAFFLDSSDVLGQVGPDRWGVARGQLAFYSRAVVDPRWGLRATWRGADSEATALAVRDAGGGLLLRPGALGTESVEIDQASQLVFARHRTQWSADWAVAALLTRREWQRGASTDLLGLDWQGQLGEDERLRGHWLLSRDLSRLDVQHGLLRAAQATQDQAGWLQWRHHGEHWRWQADWERIGTRFVNDNGFVPQAGIQRHTLELTRVVHPEDGPLQEWEATLRALDTQALRDPERGVTRRQPIGQALQAGGWMLGPWSTEVWGHANWQRQRARADGGLHRPRSLTLGMDSHPGPLFTFAHFELEWGQRLDVDADRVGRGYALSSQFNWRWVLPGGWGMELEQRWARAAVRAPSGQAALAERQDQTKLVLYLSPEQAVRLLHQQGRSEREAEAGWPAQRDREQVSTLTWLARAGALRGWSVGASWSRVAQAQPLQRELFVKFQQGWNL
ncbi:hypothetical protein HNQ51_002563 [Inhella inkyongensis]|uniref:Carbohydrate-binding domain-containing protein n=1 Tax=Inhella inkyongensis TaxID=392593 RepID=A0A840S8X8_9BURK|nr:DUF5916 domain-containing protein [Inhella inkyongensis]MBB5205244.1 hypothetical protein [Inhella inkyongensis]